MSPSRVFPSEAFAFFLLLASCHGHIFSLNAKEKTNGTIGEKETGSVSSLAPITYLFHYNPTELENQALRVNVSSSSAKAESPILFVIRRRSTVQSWTVPLVLNRTAYNEVSRTLCPFSPEEIGNVTNLMFYLDLSTSSEQEVNFTFTVFLEDAFTMTLGEERSLTVSPSTPSYYQYRFNQSLDFDEIIVKVSSTEETKDICAIASVEAGECPVHDLPSNVRFSGAFQTFTRRAGITVQRKGIFEKGLLFLTFVVFPGDEPCISGVLDSIDNELDYADRNASVDSRMKSFTVTVEMALPLSQYVSPIAVSLTVCFGFFLLVFLGILLDWHLLEKKVKRGGGRKRGRSFMEHLSGSETPDVDDGQGGYQNSLGGGDIEKRLEYIDEDAVSINVVSSLDIICDKRKHGEDLRVSDLARFSEELMRSKYKRYAWSVVTMGVFYALPSIQLVIAYQIVLNSSGNQDLCYYNFWCAHPAGIVSDFNHVWSNIAYILLGFLFALTVYRRSRRYRANCGRLADRGLPQYFGLSYAMAVALIAEGIMSGTYHICPSRSNFQFDTSFMYLIAVLSILKLYQSRHAEVQAYAYKAYAAMAALILIAVIGVLFNTLAFWLVFFFLYVFVILYMNLEIYYIGAWSLGKPLFRQWKTALLCEKPYYPNRRLFLIVATFFNFAFALFGAISQFSDFATYLLAVMIVNLFLYLLYYVIMKFISKERLSKIALLLTALLIIFWIPALYFFTRGLTNWQESPSVSRENNADCILMGFYDDHDVWHFLSAFGLFFGFLAFLTIDDDLEGVDRSDIKVF